VIRRDPCYCSSPVQAPRLGGASTCEIGVIPVQPLHS
jgi:hypothetical protein